MKLHGDPRTSAKTCALWVPERSKSNKREPSHNSIFDIRYPFSRPPSDLARVQKKRAAMRPSVSYSQGGTAAS